MPIRIGGTTTPQEPQRPSAAATSPIAVPEPIGNPAAQVAGAATQAERLAASIYQEQRDREIQTRVMEVDIERRRSDAEIIDGYLQQQGKAAVEQRGDVMARLQQNQKRVRAGITDREVARVFAGQELALTDAASRQIDAHFRRENLRWQDDTLQARRELLASTVERVADGEGGDLARGRLSPEAVRTRSALHSTIAEQGKLLGWSEERTQAEVAKADTQAFGQVAESLVRQGRFDDALAVLEAHGDRVDVGVRDRLIEFARNGRERAAAAQRTLGVAEKAQAFVLKVADEAASRHQSIAEQRSYALSVAEWSHRGKRLTVEEYDAVLSRMERHFRIRDEQDAVAVQQAQVAAERFLAENPLKTLEDAPELFEAAKRNGQLKGLLEFQRSGRYSTDPEVQSALQALSDEDLRKVPATRLWVELRPHMSNQALDAAMARHARAQGDAKPEHLQILSISDRTTAAARSLGILPKDPRQRASGDQQKRFEAWQRRFEQELHQWETQNGKKADPQDVQKLLDLQVLDTVEIVTKGYVWDSVERGVPLSTLPDRMSSGASVVVGVERIELKRIPERAWSEIASYLQQQGVAPTASAIADRWVSIGYPGDLQPQGGK